MLKVKDGRVEPTEHDIYKFARSSQKERRVESTWDTINTGRECLQVMT